MIRSIRVLNDIVSLEQDISLYNWSFENAISNGLVLNISEYHSFSDCNDYLSSFKVESFETTRGRIESFEEVLSIFIEIELDIIVENIDLGSIYSPIIVINHKETTRYEVLSAGYKTYIEIPYEIMFLGQRFISDSKTIISNMIKGSLRDIEDSIFSSILTDAIDAKNIHYSQLFMPTIGTTNTQYNINMKQLDIFSFHNNIGAVENFKIFEHITFLFVLVSKELVWLDINQVEQLDEYVQIPPETIDTDDIISSNMSLRNLPGREPVYSELMSFRSMGEELVFDLFPFAFFPYGKSFETLYSNELKMINIVRGSSSDSSIPYLEADIDKGYKLTSNYVVNGSYPLRNAFNGNLQSPAIYTSYREGDIVIKLPEVQMVNSYSVGIGSYYNAIQDSPSGWTIYTSMDGSLFVELETVNLGRQMNLDEIISRKIDARPLAKYIKIYFQHIGFGGGWTRVGLIDIIFIDKSYGYKIIDLDPYYSHPWEPVAKIYNPGDYTYFDDYFIATAVWIDHKDISGITGEESRFRISGVEQTSLEAIIMDYILVSLSEVPDTIVDVDGYISPYMIIQAGIKTDINTDGIYRDVFLRTEQNVTNTKTPWLMNFGSIVKISDTKFYDISFENTEISVYLLSDTKKTVILLDWEQILIDGSIWDIPEHRMHPYIKIESANGDFIIISLSVSGGSVTHLHKDGYMNMYEYGFPYYTTDEKLLTAPLMHTVDASKAESYALEVSSSRYRKYAKVIRDTIDGLVYDTYIIDDAMLYLKKYEYCALFFNEIKCNPIVLGSIIRDKKDGMIGKNIFSNTGEYQYENIYFIQYDDNEILDGDDTFSYVIDHRDVFILNSNGYIDAEFTNLTPGNMIALNIIDNCGVGSLCHNSMIENHEFIGVLLISSISPLVAIYSNQLLMTGGDSYRIPILEEYGIINTKSIVFDNFVEISLPTSYSDITTSESNLVATLGTRYDALMYDGHMTIGLYNIDGIISDINNFSTIFPDTILSDTYSEFTIKMTIHTRNDYLKSYFFGGGIIEVDIDFINLEEFYDKTPYMWMKMFFPSNAGASDISARIMDFNLTEQYFSKDFVIPYVYVDDPFIDPVYHTSKSGNGDIQEVKIFESDDPFPSHWVEKKEDKICGPERTITYLDFQAFDHIFSVDNKREFGNYTWEDKELLMSAFIRIATSNVIAPGQKLANADIMKRTLTELRLSFIENLDVVADWHIEEFVLTTEDFGLAASESEKLSSIDEQFRALLKAVTSTLGQEILTYEQTQEMNLFPNFPERPTGGNAFAELRVYQFFIVQEY